MPKEGICALARKLVCAPFYRVWFRQPFCPIFRRRFRASRRENLPVVVYIGSQGGL